MVQVHPHTTALLPLRIPMLLLILTIVATCQVPPSSSYSQSSPSTHQYLHLHESKLHILHPPIRKHTAYLDMNISQAALRSATGHPDPLPVTASRRKADQITPTPHREKTVLFDGHAGTDNLAPSPPRGYQGPPKATKPSESNNDPPFTPKQVLTGVYNNIRSNVATAVEAYTILTPLRPRRTTEDSEKQAPWTTDVLAPATESTASVSDTSSLTTLSAPPATSPSKPSPGRLLAPNGRLPNRYSMPALPAPADNNFNPPTLNTATLMLTHNEDDAEGLLPDEETLRPNKRLPLQRQSPGRYNNV